MFAKIARGAGYLDAEIISTIDVIWYCERQPGFEIFAHGDVEIIGTVAVGVKHDLVAAWIFQPERVFFDSEGVTVDRVIAFRQIERPVVDIETFNLFEILSVALEDDVVSFRDSIDRLTVAVNQRQARRSLTDPGAVVLCFAEQVVFKDALDGIWCAIAVPLCVFGIFCKSEVLALGSCVADGGDVVAPFIAFVFAVAPDTVPAAHLVFPAIVDGFGVVVCDAEINEKLGVDEQISVKFQIGRHGHAAAFRRTTASAACGGCAADCIHIQAACAAAGSFWCSLAVCDGEGVAHIFETIGMDGEGVAAVIWDVVIGIVVEEEAVADLVPVGDHF